MTNSGGNPNEGFGYWMRWQVPVCAVIIILPSILALIFVSRVKRVPLNVNDLWIPCWRGLNPLWLLIYRASVFVIMASILCLELVTRGVFTFYFYTEWTFALVMIYFALGTIVSAQGCCGCLKSSSLRDEERATTNRPENHDEHEIEAKAGYLGYLMQTVYQIRAAILTDIVFWCILVPFLTSDRFRLTPFMGMLHSLNLVFLLLDTSLSNLSFPWFRLAYFVFWSCIYVIFQWVLHACGFTWWPYPFLELSTPWAPLWYFALALVHIPCFGAYVLISKAKISAFSLLFPRVYVRSY